MTDKLEIAAKLDEARALIEKGWCQHDYRRGDCFCVYGAIRQVVLGTVEAFSAEVGPPISYIAQAINHPDEEDEVTPDVWNDAPGRTQSEVIEAFRKAADLARASA